MTSEDLESIRKLLDRGDLRHLVSHLEERAFCYESPADFRAGVEAMARHIEELLEAGQGSDHRQGVKSSA